MGYNLLINGVYWGYNPFTNHLLTLWDILAGIFWKFQDPGESSRALFGMVKTWPFQGLNVLQLGELNHLDGKNNFQFFGSPLWKGRESWLIPWNFQLYNELSPWNFQLYKWIDPLEFPVEYDSQLLPPVRHLICILFQQKKTQTFHQKDGRYRCCINFWNGDLVQAVLAAR